MKKPIIFSEDELTVARAIERCFRDLIFQQSYIVRELRRFGLDLSIIATVLKKMEESGNIWLQPDGYYELNYTDVYILTASSGDHRLHGELEQQQAMQILGVYKEYEKCLQDEHEYKKRMREYSQFTIPDNYRDLPEPFKSEAERMAAQKLEGLDFISTMIYIETLRE